MLQKIELGPGYQVAFAERIRRAVAQRTFDIETSSEPMPNPGASTVTAPLKAGTYTFYCAVDSHRHAARIGREPELD